MVRKFCATCCILALQLVAAGQVSSGVKEAIMRLEKGLQEKDIAVFEPDLADDFSVSTASWPSSKRYLQQILTLKRTFESIAIISDKTSTVGNGLTRVEVQLKEEAKEPIKTGVVFNADGKIMYIDYFDELYGNFRYKPSALVATIPFEFDGSAIILTLHLNDSPRLLRFLFDTGADGMAVDKVLAEELGLEISYQKNSSFVGGSSQVSISSGNTVHLDKLSVKGQNIAIFDQVANDIDGIIGLNLARFYIITLNFDKQELSLYSMGDYAYEGVGEVFPITVPGGVALLAGYINLTGKEDTKGRFVVDTGANYHLIGFSPFVRKNRMLLSGFKPESQGSTVSMGKATPVYSGKMHSFRLSNGIELKDMPVTLQASTGSGPVDLGADGSIGIKFLSRFNITINLLAKELYLTPNKRAELTY